MERELKKELAKLWILEDEANSPEKIKSMVQSVIDETELLMLHLHQLNEDATEIMKNWENYHKSDVVDLAECYTQINDREELIEQLQAKGFDAIINRPEIFGGSYKKLEEEK